MKKIIALATVAFAIVASLVFANGKPDHFNHTDHAKLFPLCTSCHTGIESGDEANFYPKPSDCARCHDDNRERKVDWQAPTRVANNLKFTHPDHIENSGEKDCALCHVEKGSSSRMNVSQATPERCMNCHAEGKGPGAHLAGAVACATCHVPLKNAKLAQNQIAEFPQPPSHKQPDFFANHKTTTEKSVATCNVCHTQESCARCHANAASVKVIAALGSNDKVAALVINKKPFYPKPADHSTSSFRADHGKLAIAGIATCSNCHTRESCQQCHSGSSGADQIAKLPVRVAGLAPGVNLKSRMRSAHPAGFASAHAVQAGAAGENCTSCHEQKFCSDCHQGADSRKFHPANFASRHSAAVYANEQDCASCHNRESFCQTCHTGLGLNSTGKRTTQFHTAQSVWLLQHGQPARQNLESCASCHTQSSCTRCHASNAKGGWGVNPHGSMNVASMKDKNPVVCLQCHKDLNNF